jgi:hypothetical protein
MQDERPYTLEEDGIEMEPTYDQEYGRRLTAKVASLEAAQRDSQTRLTQAEGEAHKLKAQLQEEQALTQQLNARLQKGQELSHKLMVQLQAEQGFAQKLNAQLQKNQELSDKLKAKLQKRQSKKDDEVSKCLTFIVNRTILTAKTKDKYPPHEWHAEENRPVQHKCYFFDSKRFQEGLHDCYGVNIDHTVTAARGKRRQNHQVFFPTGDKAQAYLDSLPKVVPFANDSQEATKRARGREQSQKDIVLVTAAVLQGGTPRNWEDLANSLFDGRLTGHDVSRMYYNTIKPLVGPSRDPTPSTECPTNALKKKRKTTSGAASADRPTSLFQGVRWVYGRWTAECGKIGFASSSEIAAALAYDGLTNSTQRKNFLTPEETGSGHVRVMKNGFRGTFGIYAGSSGSELAKPQLPEDILPDHAWEIQSEILLDHKIRFHAPSGADVFGRRVRIDGVEVKTQQGTFFARFDGYLDNKSTMQLICY